MLIKEVRLLSFASPVFTGFADFKFSNNKDVLPPEYMLTKSQNIFYIFTILLFSPEIKVMSNCSGRLFLS